MSQQEKVLVMAHPQVVVHLEPTVRGRNPQSLATGRMPGTVGQYFYIRCMDGVDPPQQFEVTEKGRHGAPPVVGASGVG